jgi:hypothetical protein
MADANPTGANAASHRHPPRRRAGRLLAHAALEDAQELAGFLSEHAADATETGGVAGVDARAHYRGASHMPRDCSTRRAGTPDTTARLFALIRMSESAPFSGR